MSHTAILFRDSDLLAPQVLPNSSRQRFRLRSPFHSALILLTTYVLLHSLQPLNGDSSSRPSHAMTSRILILTISHGLHGGLLRLMNSLAQHHSFRARCYNAMIPLSSTTLHSFFRLHLEQLLQIGGYDDLVRLPRSPLIKFRPYYHSLLRSLQVNLRITYVDGTIGCVVEYEQASTKYLPIEIAVTQVHSHAIE